MGKPGSRSESSTKADLKFEKKLEFYAKVRDTVSGLGAQKAIVKKKKLRSRQKKLKAYDLSSFSEFLPELKAKKQPTSEFNLNCKSKKTLILKEGKQLATVLEHPAFKSDPLAAIQQHLERTQPVIEVKPEKRKNKNGSKKRKDKKLKASAGPQSMDM
ncbi:putative ribosome biogenesis protein slx9-like [Prunus avium]|uniref:Ribosome biogenesis protein slx9-like n=1 Tax=Prunus avium TaxID=42229 RepID=A0A6P5RCJ2_PRUAV|nr:putative ribosome biogenesis protein slx9-like [Prunus avium]